ncbi:MAG: DUF4159 domain-containing protein [Gemmataceae bacterium]|nr:DUF4159 domain-containing protein [Gemmataceae bacterium]
MLRWALSLCVFITGTLLAQPVAEPEPLVDRVRTAIDRGVRFLRRQEKGQGHWEKSIAEKPGGVTALALLALLNSGVPVDDPMIQRGLKYLRTVEPRFTYVVGLQTMVFVEANDPRDKQRIQTNVDWLIGARVMQAGNLLGWGYTTEGGLPDNSNTQYALLGLHAGRMGGAKIDVGVWQSIRDFYVSSQAQGGDAGGWPYHTDRGGRSSSLTMTVAGLCGLQIVGLELNRSRQELQADGSARKCGIYPEDEAVKRAFEWLARPTIDGQTRFRFADTNAYYNAYGIERAGRLTGRRFIAGRDWYREGCEYIVDRITDNDSWRESGLINSEANTCLALLFLSKGRTPVLISKWAHGPAEGWNNKHFDLKHLVEFASKEIFKGQPLAWQSYDARKLNFGSVKQRLAEVGALLQSPIVFINGHELAGMTDTQEQMLKQYIEEGGFVIAEACCGRREFADGFRRLMAKLFPDNPLRPLPPEHPIWNSWAVVRPDISPLEAIDLGCKTVVVFSPRPLSGYWEENQVSEGRGRDAFRLAGNLIAYATGLELPKARLTTTELIDERSEKVAPRGFLKVAQLRHEGDWQPAPRAMKNLMRHLREREKLDVSLAPEELTFTHPDVFKYKFLYLHGRSGFTCPPAGIENLRANLSTGGLLLADACCGSKTFDAAFREFAKKLYPEHALVPIPPNDPLYSADINGTAIGSVKVRMAGGPGRGYENAPPALEGIAVDGRWVVVYSRFDLGCALEKHTSGDCVGHDHDSALKLAGAAVNYLLKK